MIRRLARSRLEVLTNRLENTSDREAAETCDIDYSISLKGLMEGHNQLSITLMYGKEGEIIMMSKKTIKVITIAIVVVMVVTTLTMAIAYL